jgi:hypothetical protein
MSKINVISAEENESFHKFNVNNIVVELPTNLPAKGQMGVWVNVKYLFENESKSKSKSKLGLLKIQTSELFSYGISKYDANSPYKMSFAMVNRKLREDQNKGDDISEDSLVDIKVENETIDILEKITEKVKEEMRKPEMIKALGKDKKDKDSKKWLDNVENMEVVKRKEQENGIDAVYVNAKVVTNNNFMKSRFLMLDEDAEEGVVDLDQEETIEKLSQKTINCKATVILVIDSVFVSDKPCLQIKLSEAVISEFVELKVKRNIIIPERFRNRSIEKKRLDELVIPNKKIIKESDDDDSD